MNPHEAEDLSRIYSARFDAVQSYRNRIWEVLTRAFFQKWIPQNASVLDLGCGYGEFINNIEATVKYGMDLNPQSRKKLAPTVTFLEQDCSHAWPLPEGSLDIVFTSNFFEHLPDKVTLGRTLDEAVRCLKKGGHLICLGPNIRHTGGAYWDFWDHHLALTEHSLTEALETRGMLIEAAWDRFLPYSMVRSRQHPLWMLKLYLHMPLLWKILGKQFLVIAQR